jgi:5'-nucleotidase (lipoprotein e(P4) family)
MKYINSTLFVAILLLAACSSSKKTTDAGITNKGKIWALLWQQQAAEYKALCFQAYNIAKLRVDDAIKQTPAKPYAIVTDIDETLLDNSPYDAQRAVNNLDFTTTTWKQWTAKGIADTVPGAPSFLKYAASKGVEIFYVTNRDEDERAGTLKNLALYNFPNADNAHLLLKGAASSKEGRRQQVLDSHTIILLCGDNLADFDALYDNKPSTLTRAEATQKLMREFGNRYIVLPNPSYGDFEGAWFKFNYKLSPAQKDSVIKANIKTDKSIK